MSGSLPFSLLDPEGLYKLHDHPLQSTDSVKYLGLTLISDLKFNTHINNVTAKANSILGLLRRNLKISSQAVKTQAYQSLVRSHLEYAATVLSPHTSDNIRKVEMVQRRAARCVCNRWHNTILTVRPIFNDNNKIYPGV